MKESHPFLCIWLDPKPPIPVTSGLNSHPPPYSYSVCFLESPFSRVQPLATWEMTEISLRHRCWVGRAWSAEFRPHLVPLPILSYLRWNTFLGDVRPLASSPKQQQVRIHTKKHILPSNFFPPLWKDLPCLPSVKVITVMGTKILWVHVAVEMDYVCGGTKSLFSVYASSSNKKTHSWSIFLKVTYGLEFV
jgi:hypothetical protein